MNGIGNTRSGNRARKLVLGAALTATAVTTVALTGATGAYAAPAKSATKTVSYQGVHFAVPVAWSVIDLARQPNTCVRLDQHVVYLGPPGVEQQCPAVVRGRTEALIVEADPDATGGPQTVENPVAHEIVATGSGIKVTAAYGTDPNTVRQILASASLASTGPTTKANAVPNENAVYNAVAPAVTESSSTDFTGQGFDPCSAPSGSAMSAWRASSPYQAIGVYIGGVNRACSQPNLTASWVSQQVLAGWKFIPLYLGVQASDQSCIGCTLITSPTSEGTSAADDAANQAASLGLSGVVIYYDMESYSFDRSSVALAFESAWTSEVHARGYKSGIYSSASTGIADLANHYSSYVMPDVVDFASWPGSGSTSTSDPNIPANDWANHQRIHQYGGPRDETYGGYTINIDQDYLDVQVGSPAPAPVEVFGGKLVDFTGDGKPDVVGRLNDSLYVWPNATSGQPSLAGAVNLGGGWATMNSLITADFNGDGKPDIIARQGDHLYFWLNTSTPGSPSLGGPNDLGYGWSSIDSIMAANLNGDAKIDIIGRLGDHLYVWTGYGTGINAPVDLGYGWQTINSLMSTDFNSDGRADIIGRLGDHLYVWTSNGTGLNNPADLGQGWTSITSLTTADFTNDGHPDIIGRLGDNLYVWAGNGTGLGSPANFGSGWGSISPLMTGDFTGDGKTDVVSRLSDNLYTWAGNGTGLGSPTNLGNGWGTIALITKS